jgi:hypothetical protein
MFTFNTVSSCSATPGTPLSQGFCQYSGIDEDEFFHGQSQKWNPPDMTTGWLSTQHENPGQWSSEVKPASGMNLPVQSGRL